MFSTVKARRLAGSLKGLLFNIFGHLRLLSLKQRFACTGASYSIIILAQMEMQIFLPINQPASGNKEPVPRHVQSFYRPAKHVWDGLKEANFRCVVPFRSFRGSASDYLSPQLRQCRPFPANRRSKAPFAYAPSFFSGCR